MENLNDKFGIYNAEKVKEFDKNDVMKLINDIYIR